MTSSNRNDWREHRLVFWAMIAAAIGIGGAVWPRNVLAQDPVALVGWPRALASRGPALVDSIQSVYGNRPDTVAFLGGDTLEVVFTTATFWQKNAELKAFPYESVPLVMQAAQRVATNVWTNFGPDAGVSLIKVTFVRMRKEHSVDSMPTVPAQATRTIFTREQLETRDTKSPLEIVQLEGGPREGAATLRPYAVERVAHAGPPTGAHEMSTDGIPTSTRRAAAPGVGLRPATALTVAHAAFSDSIQREIGQHLVEVGWRGRDTMDVLIPNPPFWWKYDNLKPFPEASLPEVRQMATRVAKYIWEQRHAGDAGINLIRVRFRRDYYEVLPTMRLQHPGQVVTTQFTRQLLEAGQFDKMQLTIVEK